MTSHRSKSGKKDDQTGNLTMEAVSELLDQHRQALAADFKTSYNQLESKFNQVCSTVDDHGQRLSSLELASEDLSQRVRELENKSASHIQSFLSNFGVSDLWWFLHPNKREYSFFSHLHHTFTRIDYVLIDNELIPLLQSCTYQSIVVSDHAPIVLSLVLPGPPEVKKTLAF